jgi:hypothetical protein
MKKLLLKSTVEAHGKFKRSGFRPTGNYYPARNILHRLEENSLHGAANEFVGCSMPQITKIGLLILPIIKDETSYLPYLVSIRDTAKSGMGFVITAT